MTTTLQSLPSGTNGFPLSAASTSSSSLQITLDPLFLAQVYFRRRQYDQCIEVCTTLLTTNPYDQAVWLLKTRALTARNYIDDVEWDDEGIAEVLLDDNGVASAPRPGTSMKRPMTALGGGSNGSSTSAAIRPMTASGRPVTGFARPGTVSNRPGTSSVDAAFRGNRPGTSRVMTALGRAIRLGTASLLAVPGGPFIIPERLDFRKYAARPALGKALCDYLLYVNHNPRQALELASLATIQSNYNDWWWKERLGKCYYQLGLYRDAEGQFASSIKHTDTVASYLQLAMVYQKLDQPTAAQDIYQKGIETFPNDVTLLLGSARLHDTMGNTELAANIYRRVLSIDAGCIEAIACLASHSFYSDQPEMSLKYYRRLLQMGVVSIELWCNLGLATFHASQYDLALSCLQRAITLSNEGNVSTSNSTSNDTTTNDDTLNSDLWYNISCIAISLGDINLAYQALHIVLALDPNHAESHVNLGVVEARKGNDNNALAHATTAQRIAPWLYEGWFNGALVSLRMGDMQAAYTQCKKSLEIFPEHSDSQELLNQIQTEIFRM